MAKFNYPGQKRKSQTKTAINHANRGKAFEMALIASNNGYQAKGWAYVVKSDPPIQIQQDMGKKVIGFKKEKGFVDFFGVSHGRFLAFEAKETKVRTNFPLKNIKQHQIDTLKAVRDQGGIAFMLVNFEKLRECYILRYEQIAEWWDQMLKGGRKSIPYEWIMMHCDEVRPQRGIPYDYLACIGGV